MKKIKCRVLYRNGCYYPQIKGLLFWKHVWHRGECIVKPNIQEAIDVFHNSEYIIVNNIVVYEKTMTF